MSLIFWPSVYVLSMFKCFYPVVISIVISTWNHREVTRSQKYIVTTWPKCDLFKCHILIIKWLSFDYSNAQWLIFYPFVTRYKIEYNDNKWLMSMTPPLFLLMTITFKFCSCCIPIMKYSFLWTCFRICVIFHSLRDALFDSYYWDMYLL